jgi:hypothetical protein
MSREYPGALDSTDLSTVVECLRTRFEYHAQTVTPHPDAPGQALTVWCEKSHVAPLPLLADVQAAGFTITHAAQLPHDGTPHMQLRIEKRQPEGNQ